MKIKIFKFTVGLALCTLGLGLSASAGQRFGGGAGATGAKKDPTITTFDVPGAGVLPRRGTFANSIAPNSAIAGFTRDDTPGGRGANGARRAFVRDKDGGVIIFDAPGAGTGPFQGTRAYALNPSGTVTGWYIGADNVVHAYVRSNQGILTAFDAPDAGTGPYPEGTFPFSPGSINPEGAISGYYTDAMNVSHGFVRSKKGDITEFDALGAGTADGQGTFCFGLNPGGDTTGYYIDEMNVAHGFVRSKKGDITTFDAPDAGAVADSFQGTMPSTINPEGAITGNYLDKMNVYHGFLRAKDGTITSFDAPGAGAADDSFRGTIPSSINAGGAITGSYSDENDVNHGFVRAKDGTITSFDVPGAGAGAGQGTAGNSIAPNGAITGVYIDMLNVFHGFLRSQ